MALSINHIAPLAALLAVLAGCQSTPRAVDALPDGADPATVELAQMRDAMSGMAATTYAEPEVSFTGIGMSQISTQPGQSINGKRLMAIRAARIEALRDLTEQIHGIQLSSTTTLRDQVLRHDQTNALVAGEIRGATTLRITPKGDDGYEVAMALSPDTVRYIVRAAQNGQ